MLRMRERKWFLQRMSLGSALFFMLGVMVAQSQEIQFTNATQTFGVAGNVDDTTGAYCYGHGVAMADINNDNRPDIYISNAVRYANGLCETLYITIPGGYKENDAAWKISDPYGWTGSHGICFFDYDNDGDFDLYNATTDDRSRLYRNKGNGTYENVTDLVGLPLIRESMPDFDPDQPYGYGTRGVVAFDANNDGWMDLYGTNWGPAEKRYPPPGKSFGDPIITPPQPNEFYLNQGNGKYTRVTNSGATPINPSYLGTQGVAVFDANEDGNMDIFVAHRNYVAIDPDTKQIVKGPTSRAIYNQLFLGDGQGHFTEGGGNANLNDDVTNNCNGASFADYDNDGDYDAFIIPTKKTEGLSGWKGYTRVYKNNGRGQFTNVTAQTRITIFGFSALFLDADNDGDLDLVGPRTGDNIYFYRNDGNDIFTRVDNTGTYLTADDPRGGGVGDIDNDGDLDFYYADANKDFITTSPKYPVVVSNRLFVNKTVTNNRWLKITGRGPKGDAAGFGTKIWVYERGFMDSPAHLLGYRQVISQYGYLCQDDPVQHFGLGQRDSVDIKVRLLDKTELFMLKVPANQRISFSKPAQFVMDSGNNQLGKPSVTLALPLRVRVFDAFSKPVYGAPVNFKALDGGFIQETQPIYTDASGYAEVHYTPVAGVAQQRIRAVCPILPTQISEFSCSIASPVYTVNILSGEGQSGYVNETLPSPLVIRVNDAYAAPVSKAQVRFKVISGGGKVAEADSITLATGPTGQASVFWRMGNVPGSNQRVRVFLIGDRTRYAEFTATTYGAAAAMQSLSPVSFVGEAGKALPDSLVYRILDAQNHAVRNHPVRFTVTAGNGLINGQSMVTLNSDRDGFVKAEWILGPQAGFFNNRLQVYAGVLQGSPLQVSASGQPGAAARLLALSGLNQSAVAGGNLPEPVVVALLDSLQNPIANVQINALMVAPNGQETLLSPATTDSSGRASFHWTLTEVVGVHRFMVRFGDLDPAEIRAQSMAHAPMFIEIVDGDGQRALVNNRVEKPLRVRVMDERRAPLSAIPVLFLDVNAMGTFPDGATAVTNSAGIASCIFQFGAHAGIHEVEAKTDGVDESVLFILTADPRPNHVPVISALTDTSLFERQQLEFTVNADDADEDSLQIWMEGVPDSARFSPETRTNNWTPTYQQAGEYQIMVCAHDIIGEVQRHPITIQVLNVNQPPQLLAWTPADSIVWTDVFRPYDFLVSAHDGDGDSLKYAWLLDGVYVGADSLVSLLPNPSWTMHMVLKVNVFDAEFSVSRTWHIYRQTGAVGEAAVAAEYALLQNHPNPFNPQTTITFSMPKTDRVRIWVCNISGQTVRLLSDAIVSSGRHSITWDGRDGRGELLPSGLYYYGMESGSFREIRKLLFVK